MQQLQVDIPSSCIQYKRFINLANEYTHLPNIAYYVLLHVAMNCLSADQGFSTKIISHLELIKPSITDLDQKKTGEQMEQQAIGLFTLSVKQDEVQPSPITAKQYLNASVLLDCLAVFENIENSDKYKEMSKFAKFRSKTILSDYKTKGSAEPYKTNEEAISFIEPSAPEPMDVEQFIEPQPQQQQQSPVQHTPVQHTPAQQSHTPVQQQHTPVQLTPVQLTMHQQTVQQHVPHYQPHSSSTGMTISGDYVQDVKSVQRLCKHISSALEYDDIATSENLLIEALSIVRKYKK